MILTDVREYPKTRVCLLYVRKFSKKFKYNMLHICREFQTVFQGERMKDKVKGPADLRSEHIYMNINLNIFDTDHNKTELYHQVFNLNTIY